MIHYHCYIILDSQWSRKFPVRFVWFDSLCPCQQYFSYVRTSLSGMNQYKAGIDVSCSRTQRSDTFPVRFKWDWLICRKLECNQIHSYCYHIQITPTWTLNSELYILTSLLFIQLTHRIPIVYSRVGNSVDPDQLASQRPTGLDLQCLKTKYIGFSIIRVKL